MLSRDCRHTARLATSGLRRAGLAIHQNRQCPQRGSQSHFALSFDKITLITASVSDALDHPHGFPWPIADTVCFWGWGPQLRRPILAQARDQGRRIVVSAFVSGRPDNACECLHSRVRQTSVSTSAMSGFDPTQTSSKLASISAAQPAKTPRLKCADPGH